MGGPETVLDDVISVVVTTLGIEDRASTIDETTQLIDGMAELDSMAIVEVVTALEDRFGLQIDDEDITGDVFETVGTLAAFVRRQVAS